jgi:integrase
LTFIAQRSVERQAELIRAGVMTTVESAISRHQNVALSDHLAAYVVHLDASGVSAKHLYEVRRQLKLLASECHFGRLADLNAEPLERWLTRREKDGASARTRNTYLAAILAFANWCLEGNRLVANPFARIAKANDRRRNRRAITEEELLRLLDSARRRPLLDAMTIRMGKRKGKAVAKLSDKRRRQLEMLGCERALMYKTMLLTGLRRGELASVTVRQLHLDGQVAALTLDAKDEKAREGALIVLRGDLAADLQEWLSGKLKRLQDEASRVHRPIPAALPADTLLFRVPVELVKILDRDLKLAGIPKVDERGRTIDVHALRTTFGTHLSKAGVAPRTAQAAMRHSSIDLTMNVYTDPKLLDVAGAVEALPEMPLADKNASKSVNS